ncbi:CD59 glycoprotein-like [Megalops cyprinoides]|uniref:CD59 glycoprotein-like n=1 Tax=Megalops cyprinoides TaxID=118141 RepID=UPI001863E367|nr:CD59 glycoprotein-like [Megalops cyprinoides]
MNTSLGIVLFLCLVIFSLGSALQCYKCSDYSGRCSNVQDCTYEDACLTLSERGGKTIRRCIRYTDCDNARLTQMFPAVSGFTYRCCSSNLCNSSPPTAMSKSVLGLLVSLVVFWWCLL